MNKNIQALRALSAIIVIFFHAVVTIDSYEFSYSKLEILSTTIKNWGPISVDIFFIISGYLMFMINDKKPRAASRFFLNRIERVVPMYWLLTISLFLAHIMLPSTFREMTYNTEKLVTSLFFVSKHFGYTDPGLYVGWTLEYEMLFYSMFSLTLLLKINNIIRLFILLFTISIMIALNWYSSIAIEFLYGGMIFMFLKNKQIKHNNIYWIFIILSVVAVILLPIPTEDNRFIIWGLPATTIFTASILVKSTASEFLVKIGDASYSIYLIQVFALPILAKVLIKFLPNLEGLIASTIISIGSIFIGYLFYICVEKNTQSILNKIA